MHESKADRQVESPRTGASGVDEEHPIALTDRWLVGVTANDDFEAGRFRDEIEFLDVVDDVHPHLPDLQGCRLGQSASPGPFIDVPSDRRDGGHASQRLEDFGRSNIPSMHDQIAPLQRPDRFQPQETMGI